MKNSVYSCKKCDAQFPKWSGRCSECGGWGTLELSADNKKKDIAKSLNNVAIGETVKFNELSSKQVARLQTTSKEFNRVLGEGIVQGSLMLLGGDPGIGKSTLVLQIADQLKQPVLYVSAEESAQQIKIRLERLHLKGEQVIFLAEDNVEIIIKTALKERPSLIIIDSIQTIYTSDSDAEPGNVSQLKACCVKFLEIAKKENIPVILVGHVTKDGQVAGPKTLEHLVDVVLYLEGESFHNYRILRGVKNRFGSTNEIGIFSMEEKGLIDVPNPSQIFLENRSHNPGSCITAVVEGKRVFLVEVQALVSKTIFGYPVRKANGFDVNRLQMLVAVLSKVVKIPLATQDIFINIAGGLKIKEPAVDLAVCLAIISSFSGKNISDKIIAIGEVGLGGEIRNVNQLQNRVKEAAKFGYQQIISYQQYSSIKDAVKILK